MFQRLKGAFDSIAEEQARQRQAQQPPSRNRTASISKRSSSRTASPSTRLPRKSHDTAEKAADLTGPDPDPASFDPEAVSADDGDPPGSSAPRPPIDSSEPPARTSDLERNVAPSEQDEEYSNQTKNVTQSTHTELPVDVKAKLRRLSKLESKYQDLLRAYRKAHARNSSIEPFEACLRENTPLTSINDPGALVEYLNQLNTKGDMVLDELKRVSAEKDTVKQKLDEAEQKTQEAWDEVSQLRQQKDNAVRPNDVPLPDTASSTERDSDTAGPSDASSLTTEKAKSPSITSAMSLPVERAFSCSQSNAQESPVLHEGSEDLFSIDDEVSRLQAALQQREGKITELEDENRTLTRDLSSAKESAEHMMHDLEKAQEVAESLRSSLEASQEKLSEKNRALESTIAELKSNLIASATERQAKDQDLQNQKNDVAVLQQTTQDLKSKLENAENAAESSKAKIDNHKKNISQLESTMTELNTKLIVAQAEKLQVMVNDIPTKVDTPTKEGETKQIAEQENNESTLSNGTVTPAKSKKKSSKHKKKKVTTALPVEDSENLVLSTAKGDEEAAISSETKPSAMIVDLENQIANYVKQMDEKSLSIEKLNDKLRSQQDLLEEIETLKDQLLNIGQEHIEAKEKVKNLQAENSSLQDALAKLETEIEELRMVYSASKADSEANHVSLEADLAALKSRSEAVKLQRDQLEESVKSLVSDMAAHQKTSMEFEDLNVKAKSLQTEVSVAEQLAASRYKEITRLGDLVQKAQPELASLRGQVTELRKSKSELTAMTVALRKLQAQEDSTRADLEAARRIASEKEDEIKCLNIKIKQELSQKQTMEAANSQLLRDLQRSQREEAEAVAIKERSTKELEHADRDLQQSRTRLLQVEEQVEQLNRAIGGLRDEISLKTAQHASAQSLMISVRDQAAEMAAQIKEAKERCEALEEELTGAHRLMNERGREGETMRRLLSEVEGRAESRVKEMRERMDLAIQERDRAEDEVSNSGRRRVRELDELRNKLREMERELKHAVNDKDDIWRAEKELRKQKEDDTHRVEQATQEISDVRRAMSELRDALDAGEKQARDLELEKSELRSTLENAQQRLEKLQKTNKTMSDELRSLRATRVRTIDSGGQSSRSSMDSRVASPASGSQELSGRTIARASGSASQVDFVYLKNVLLQFLEQRDKKHQTQLVPVLGMLLHFDRKDEQKWMTAINAK